MKRFLKPIAQTLLLLVLAFTGYYLLVLTSKGTTVIHYIEPQKKYTTFRELMQDPALKGKTIYVDVWRTTCGPCLEEFKAGPPLKQYFKSYGDKVAFLYIGTDISVPGEEFRWKRMVEKKNLTGYHYFISREFLDTMWREVVKDSNIPPRFPQYFIVNKKGEVVDYDAPRPTDKKVYPALTQALNKKI